MCLEFRVTLYRRQFNCWIVNYMLDTRIQPSISVITDFSVTYLPKTFLLFSLVGRPALVVPTLLHFRMMKASVLPGTFRAAEVVFLPQVSASVRWCLWALLTSWLFTLICIVSCDTSQSWSREMEGPCSWNSHVTTTAALLNRDDFLYPDIHAKTV